MALSKKASVASCDEFFTCQSLEPSELRDAFPGLSIRGAASGSTRLSVTSVSRHNSGRSLHRTESAASAAEGNKRKSSKPAGEVGLSSFASSESLKSSREFYSLPDCAGYPSAPVRRIEPLFERVTVKDLVLGLVRLIAALLLLLLFGLLLCAVVPVSKLCRLLVHACYASDSKVPLSTFEAIWFPDLDALTFDRAVVQCLLLIDDRVELAQLRELLQARLVNARAHAQTEGLLFPRYSQRLVATWLGYAWRSDEHFNVSNHLLSEPSVRTRPQLNDCFSSLSRAPLDRHRPLWQVRVAHLAERQTALIIRVHPAVAEPLELVHVLCNHPSMLQDNTLASHLIGNAASRWDVFRAFLKRAVCAFWTPYFFVAHFVRKAPDSNLLHGTIEPRIDNMQVRFVRSPLRDVNKLLSLTNADSSEMYFSLLAGAVRAYEQFYGLEHPYDHTALALSMESAPFALWLKRQSELRQNSSKLRGCHHRNFFCEMQLPCNTEACLPRLWTVQYRDAPQAYSVRMYLPVLFDCLFMLLPSRRFGRLVSSFYEKATCCMAFQHGSESVLMLGSHEIRELMVWQTPPRNVSTSVVFTNYAGNVAVAVCADQRVLPNVELLLRAIQNQIDILTEQLARKKTFSDDEMLIEGKPRAPVKQRITLASIEARLRRISEDPHEANAKANLSQMTNEDINNVLESIQSELDEHEQASANATSADEKAAIDRRVQNLRTRFQMVIHETVRRNRTTSNSSNSAESSSNSSNKSSRSKATTNGVALRHTEVDLGGTTSPRPPSVVLTTHDEEVIELSGPDADSRRFPIDRLRERRRSTSLPFVTKSDNDESGFASAQHVFADTPHFPSLTRPLRPVSASPTDDCAQPHLQRSDNPMFANGFANMAAKMIRRSTAPL